VACALVSAFHLRTSPPVCGRAVVTGCFARRNRRIREERRASAPMRPAPDEQESATDWLWLGLPRMGRSLPKLHSTPSRTSFGRRRVCPIRPSGVGVGRRLRVDDSARRHALGLCRHMVAIVRVRVKKGRAAQGASSVANSGLLKIDSPEVERPGADDQRRRGLERWENEGGSIEHARTSTTGRSK